MFKDKLFSEKISVSETGCWEYTSALDKKGYGRVRRRSIQKEQMGAHRYAWLLTYGEMPSLCVCHRCDNPCCVRPDHLFLGTVADNNWDKIRKGRSNAPPQRGEKNHNSKLKKNDVVVVRCLIHLGLTNTRIAKIFGVTHSMISCIRLGKSWV